MHYARFSSFVTVALVLAAIGSATLRGRGAIVLVGTNGERFVGTVIEQTTNQVVFDSELAGRLTFSPVKNPRTSANLFGVTDQCGDES